MKSRAVIVGDSNHCIVLWPQGPGFFEAAREAHGDADQLGFGPIEGIRIWEGQFLGGEYDSWNGDYNDVYPDDTERTFRAPTEQELMDIIAGKCPWPESSMHTIERLAADIRLRFPTADARIDFGLDETCVSWLNLKLAGREVIVQWSPSAGFGLSVDHDPDFFTHKPDETQPDYDSALERAVVMLTKPKI